ncbi:hypothetical protein ACHAPT_013072 [Fusarium lateritium]
MSLNKQDLSAQVEYSENVDHADPEILKEHVQSRTKEVSNTMGTVKLTEGATVYIPTPTADPRDPLNMSLWRKMAIVVVISIFSVLGLSLTSGFGGLIGFYAPRYLAEGHSEAELWRLLTWPGLFMGLGNLFGMPLAYAIGRRLILLVSTVILVVTSALCAAATNYDYHLAARCVMGLAAGQSEALVPMIAQEIFFLHERGQALMVQLAVQIALSSVWVLFASPIAGAITPEWWYGLGAILAGLQCVITFIIVPETKYNRDLRAFQESSDGPDDETADYCTEKPPLDTVNFQPRTWRSDLALWVDKPDWKLGWETFKQTFEMLFLPQVFWAMALNGFTLAVNVGIGMTYASILTAPPYNWSNSTASYANCGQIVTALVGLPIFGRGSDKLIKWFAGRRGGFHEPEIRLLPLIFPTIVGVFTCVLYGVGAAHPENYHWFTYVWAIAAYYFCFIGANITAITYLLDSYPTRTGPTLIIICAFRGFIAFGVNYDLNPWVQERGYEFVFSLFGALTGGIALIGVPVFIWGKKLRNITGRYIKEKSE